MATQHWFDGRHRRLLQEAPRRGFLSLAGALLAGVGLCTSSRKGGAKRKHRKGNHKHHGNGKGNGKPKPKPAKCSQGACAAQWPDDKANRDYCEFICRQCDGEDPREFCIIEGDPADPAKIAICCDHPAINCCGDYCTNLRDDRNNCGRCGRACPADVPCIDGQCACPPGKALCADGCKDTQSDAANCGSCGNLCPFGQQCCGGNCYDPGHTTCCPDKFTSCPVSEVCCQDRNGNWRCCEF